VAATPIVRPYREGDEVAINRAFIDETGVGRSLDEWAWLYPVEESGRAIVIAEIGAVVVAHCGGAPLRLAIDHEEWSGVRVTDVFGSSKAASETNPTKMMENVVEDFVQAVGARMNIQFVIGFSKQSDGEKGALPQCLGETAISKFHTYFRKRVPPSPPRRLLYRAEAARDWEPRLDDLWARVRRQYPAAVVRDADRALRRFAGHPTVRYRRFLVFPRFSSRAVGFACFRCDDGRCRWVDLLWDHHHPGALELLAHISARLVRQFGGAGEELRLAGDDATRVRLEALGFRRSAGPIQLGVVMRSFDRRLDAATLAPRLYLTMADAEVV
jgi:hypothetical protein